MLSAQNDRTIVRRAQHSGAGSDIAFTRWVRGQIKMLDAWERELILSGASSQTLQSLQQHKRWMRKNVQDGSF